jgi:hypothetical protein
VEREAKPFPRLACSNSKHGYELNHVVYIFLMSAQYLVDSQNDILKYFMQRLNLSSSTDRWVGR